MGTSYFLCCREHREQLCFEGNSDVLWVVIDSSSSQEAPPGLAELYRNHRGSALYREGPFQRRFRSRVALIVGAFQARHSACRLLVLDDSRDYPSLCKIGDEVDESAVDPGWEDSHDREVFSIFDDREATRLRQLAEPESAVRFTQRMKRLYLFERVFWRVASVRAKWAITHDLGFWSRSARKAKTEAKQAPDLSRLPEEDLAEKISRLPPFEITPR